MTSGRGRKYLYICTVKLTYVPKMNYETAQWNEMKTRSRNQEIGGPIWRSLPRCPLCTDASRQRGPEGDFGLSETVDLLRAEKAARVVLFIYVL